MVLPTAEEVTNLYLYGSKTRPNDLTNPSLLEKRRPTTIEVSRNEYMTQGAGRFFTAKDFAFIEEFFNSSPLYITPGTYSKTEILRKLGYIDVY